ncbi:MAG: NAD(P)H-hydrate dehydratase [Dysgonamonadaceae bacterium]|jgi:NAD(P)H-hydrate epimerase|nr:NAD(P)H-hydrate dehydratase [Dysgonamonadaceae bacterium]
MKIFSVSRIKEIDQYTMEHEPIRSIDLMERASSCFVDALLKEIAPNRKIIVFAGPGNNGGDALAISRLLVKQAYRIEVYLFNPKQKLSEDCEVNKTKLLALPNIVFTEITNEIPDIKIKKEDVVIDGLFGSGLNKPLTGKIAEMIQWINRSEAEVYAIDMPSGLFGEPNDFNFSGNIIRATKTFTFQSPKLSFFMPDNYQYTGDWSILNIGLHKEIMNRLPVSRYYLEKEDIRPIIKKRNRFAYKNNFGHALIVAGSKGKMGAAVLAAKAVLRSGAGLVTTHIPSGGEIIMQSSFAEAMTETDKETDIISEITHSEIYSSVGIGPGMGTAEKTQQALARFLTTNRSPLVLDADALNMIALHPEWKKEIPANSILTPHAGEFARLAGKSLSSYARLEKAQKYAEEINCILILKGAYTAICLPDGRIYFNSTGNPGMATAGSGDVLTGILTGLLSQSYTSEEAALLGVYLHGLSGDIAAAKKSKESMIAGDIIDCLGLAFQELSSW